MTTLLHLSQTIVDMQQELSREQRFSNDSCVSLLKGVSLLREALDALERDIKTAFEERDRAVTRVLGNSAPFTTTIDPDDPLGIERAFMNGGQAPTVTPDMRFQATIRG